MANIRIEIIGLDGKDLLEQVKFVTDLRRLHTKVLAEESQKIIRRVINSRISRPNSTGRLAKFTGEIDILDNGEAGIGNIDNLNANVPYWRHINFGSLEIGADFAHRLPLGGFSPGTPFPNQQSFGQGRFVPGSDNFQVDVKKPIPPMNYIETTLSEINSRAGAIMSRVRVRGI